MNWGQPWGSAWGISLSDTYSDEDGSLILVLPEFHPIDMFRRVGGFHTGFEVSDEVDALFQPGIILGSDASEEYTYQYRKGFIKNISGETKTGVKVYGFNVNSNNIVKFALEKGLDGLPLIDGSEIIKDYLTEPDLFDVYEFTEIDSPSDAMLIGNDGTLEDGEAQGVWFMQRIPKNESDIASDEFKLVTFWNDE